MSVRSEDLAFMSNLSAAVQERHNRGARWIVLLVTLGVAWCLVWAYYAELDEVTRGMGQIIPSSKVQAVQNLEGGIVEEILVKPGDEVALGQPLLKIKNQRFESTLAESALRLAELRIKVARLRAEVSGEDMTVTEELRTQWPELAAAQEGLFQANRDYMENQAVMVDHQIAQKESEIDENTIRLKYLGESREYLARQIEMARPLVERKIESETAFLHLQREMAGLQERIATSRGMIPRLRSVIGELRERKNELRISFRTRAQKELSEGLSEIAKLEEKSEAFVDQVTRTTVRAPTSGVIKQLLVNTIGGVVSPGATLAEIVPAEDSLVIEARIRPVDIAFLHPGQRATVKVTAYDFAIYGGLEGKVERISADTLMDERGMTYFLVELSTDRTHLGPDEAPLELLPGMTVSVDILTGKKTVLQYILKPILRARENALKER